MKRLLMVIGVTTSLGMLSGPATAAPTVPTSMSGTIQLVLPAGVSFAVQYFQANGCSWGPATQLNGLDGLVFDVSSVAGHSGTASLRMGTAPFAASGAGYYLSRGCSKIGGGWSHTPDGASFAISIPASAAYLVVTSSSDTTVITDQLQVSIQA